MSVDALTSGAVVPVPATPLTPAVVPAQARTRIAEAAA
jgi:hypothetical protein